MSLRTFIRSLISRRKPSAEQPERLDELRRVAPRLPEIKQIVPTRHVHAARAVPLDWHATEQARVGAEARRTREINRTAEVYRGEERRRTGATRHPEEDRYFKTVRSLRPVPSSTDPMPMPIEFDSSRMTSPADAPAYEGKGGSFDGAGASGDWDRPSTSTYSVPEPSYSPPSESYSPDSGSSDSGSSDSGGGGGSGD